MAFALTAAACLAASFRMAPPVFVLSASGQSIRPMAYPLWQAWGDRLRGRKYMTLSFDDGPFGDGVDERVLDVLERHRARAVFFVVCKNLEHAGDGLFRREADDGDLVGNHSFDHAHVARLSGEALAHEVGGCSDAIARRTGRRPVFFRPPFGQVSPALAAAERAAGLQQVLWDANSQDSWLTRPGQIRHWALAQSENFSILLMHSKPATAEVLDRVLADLERRGFVFVLPAAVVPPPVIAHEKVAS